MSALDQIIVDRGTVAMSCRGGAGPGETPCPAYAMGRQWFVAQIEPQRLAAIRAAIGPSFATFAPLVRMKPKAEPEPMFPGYLFVGFDPDRDEWGAIRRSTPGVVCILPGKGRPMPMPPGVVEALLRRCSHLGVLERSTVLPDRPTIKAGTDVLFKVGRWIDQRGVCIADQGERVAVMWSLFGRPTPVILPAADVARA
jgi:transcriptional antiterminator RfaH